MYIEPNSTLYVLKNVPLDKTYDHTLWFDDVTAQANYFGGLLAFEYNKLTYCRAGRGSIKVPTIADQLYNCNYIMFRNTSFGNKWFYAFITGVEYINNSTSQISFEIDVMQTWFFDYTLEHCFVEREHSATDAIGDNIVPENVATGPMQALASNYLDLPADVVVVTANKNLGGGRWLNPGDSYGGTMTGAYVHASSGSDIKDIIDASVEDAEGEIGSIYLASSLATGSGKSVQIPGRTQSITPKNKKLYTSPYCTYVVECPGGRLQGKYETLNTYTVSCIGTKEANTVWSICVDDKSLGKMGGVLSCTGYPTLGWVSDAYGEWCARKSTSFIGTIAKAFSASNETAAGISVGVTGGLTAGAALFSGNLVGSVQSIMSSFDQISEAISLPDTMHGSAASGSSLLAGGKFGVYTYAMGLLPQYANSIDDYFTRFGYATRRLKVPNRNVRPHWTYTKTIGCTISGSCPADDEAMICRIYDNGITFWKNGSEVGNYSLDNSV